MRSKRCCARCRRNLGARAGIGWLFVTIPPMRSSASSRDSRQKHRIRTSRACLPLCPLKRPPERRIPPAESVARMAAARQRWADLPRPDRPLVSPATAVPNRTPGKATNHRTNSNLILQKKEGRKALPFFASFPVLSRRGVCVVAAVIQSEKCAHRRRPCGAVTKRLIAEV